MKLFRSFLLVLLIAYNALFACNRTPLADPPPDDVFTELNMVCLKNLDNGIQEIVETLPPVLIVVPDHKLILNRKGKCEEVAIATPLYRWFKDIDHICLGLFPLLYPIDGMVLEKEKLEEIREHIVFVQKEIPALQLTKEQKERQNIIINRSLQIIDKTLKEGKLLPSDTYKRYFRDIEPLWMANTHDAGFEEMDIVHSQLKKWKKELTQDEWENITVLVLGHALMRKGNIFLDYFSKVFNTKVSWDKLIYLDNVRSVKEAMNLLGLIRMDKAISKIVFEDENYLYHDIFQSAAVQYMKDRNLDLD